MSKINLVVFITLLIVFTGCIDVIGQEKTNLDNDLKEYKLNGKVKSFKIVGYKAKDSFGIVLKQEITKEGFYTALPNHSYDGETILFNKDGFVMEEYEMDLIDDFKWRRIFKYDKGHRITEISKLDSSGEIGYILKHKYNEEGKLSEKNYYNKVGDLEGKWIYKYDIDNNEMVTNIYNSDGAITDSYLDRFDDRNNLIKKEFTSYNKKGYDIDYISTYRYDNSNNLVEESTKNSMRNVGQSIQTYKYNEFGNIIERKLNDYSTRFEYEYDEFNNWIKRIEFDEGFPKYILEKEIEYY